MLKAPDIEKNWALFLDLDGTLVDIASAPDKVVAPPRLIATLAKLQPALNDAVAIVSGRTFCEIDRILSPLELCGGAEHGAFFRDGSKIIEKVAISRSIPDSWRSEISRAVKRWNGVLAEEKEESVAIHYRQAPQYRDEIRRLVASIAERDPAHFEILPAKMAFEIRTRDASKASALFRLMERAPFAQRIPVYVGDDVTDEDGIKAAVDLGGFGLRVCENFGGEPSSVRDWLAHNVNLLSGDAS